MIEVRVPLWREDQRSNLKSVFYLEKPKNSKSILLRVPRDHALAESDVIAVAFLADRSGAARSFMEFLRDCVRPAAGGRVSVGKIWTAWSDLHRADSTAAEIAGVLRRDVPILFRTTFNAGPQGRGRIDGRVHRVWNGFELDVE